jgi:hypothetical protein
LHPVSCSLKHAHRAEFHSPREFIAAAWAGALGLCAHDRNRRSVASSAGNNTALHRLVRNRSAQRLAYSRSIAASNRVLGQASASNRISEQNSWRSRLPRPVLIFGDTANRRVSQTTTCNYWAARTGSKDLRFHALFYLFRVLAQAHQK